MQKGEGWQPMCRPPALATIFAGLTAEFSEVTCPKCLAQMAAEVEEALNTCTLHGQPKPREECDVCMQRGIWGDV